MRLYCKEQEAAEAAQSARDAKYAAKTEEEVGIIKEIMVSIYTEFNPKKLADIDPLLEEWAGEERLLLAKIRAKYHKQKEEAAKRERYERQAKEFFDDEGGGGS